MVNGTWRISFHTFTNITWIGFFFFTRVKRFFQVFISLHTGIQPLRRQLYKVLHCATSILYDEVTELGITSILGSFAISWFSNPRISYAEAILSGYVVLGCHGRRVTTGCGVTCSGWVWWVALSRTGCRWSSIWSGFPALCSHLGQVTCVRWLLDDLFGHWHPSSNLILESGFDMLVLRIWASKSILTYLSSCWSSKTP